jgi:hypothetical protein
VISRKAVAPPVATTLYELTARGKELVPVVLELARWGSRFIEESIVELVSEGQDVSRDEWFRIHWLGYPISRFLPDAPASAPDLTLMIRIGEQAMVVARVDGKVTTRLATPDERVDLVIHGPPAVIIGMLAGQLPLEIATNAGLVFDGALSVLDRLRGDSLSMST